MNATASSRLSAHSLSLSAGALVEGAAQRLAAGVDLAAIAPLFGSQKERKRRVDRVSAPKRIQLLEATAEAYRGAAPLEDVDRFFGVPERASLAWAKAGERTIEGRRVEVWDATWPSVEPPFLRNVPSIVSRFVDATENRRAAARVFRRPGERPLMVLIHGYRGGNYRVEEKLWPVRWFLHRGMDVALFTLPFHGVRRKDTPFFTFDPRVTIETLRQAIIDLRALLAAVRDRHLGIGVAGMSLGGYTTALLATVEPLDLVCPFIPLGSFADSARDSGWLNGSPAEQSIQYAAIERAYAAIDPFQRVPKAEPERCVVIAGAGDRITPATQAERLAEHFKAECVRFPGGHLMQTGRKRGFLALEQRMVRAGWL